MSKFTSMTDDEKARAEKRMWANLAANPPIRKVAVTKVYVLCVETDTTVRPRGVYGSLSAAKQGAGELAKGRTLTWSDGEEESLARDLRGRRLYSVVGWDVKV